MDPNYAQVREYLGEAYALQGKLDLARQQLETIAKICGSTECEEYEDLSDAHRPSGRRMIASRRAARRRRAASSYQLPLRGANLMQTGLQTIVARFARFGRSATQRALAARLLVAYLFVFEGWGKIGNYADVQAYMTQFGVEPRLLPLVIALELGGGLALALGAATRPAALALGVFSLLAALIFHAGRAITAKCSSSARISPSPAGSSPSRPLGAGAWSLDALVARRLRPAPARGPADAVPR